MPRASEHQQSSLTKALYIGDSGTGKTSSLCSLVKAGYALRIYDFDNLIAPLLALVRRECPEHLDAIEFMSFRDKMKATEQGPICDGQPKAFVNALKAIDKWEDGSRPAEWGPKTVLVIDSGTTLARSAYLWAKGMQGAHTFAEGVPMKGVHPEQFFHTAQQALMNLIAYITADEFQTNVLYIAHIKYMERDGQIKGFPVAVGTAISPEIPTYFPSVIQATKSGVGNNIKRTIRFASTNMIDLKNPRSFDMLPELDMSDGLAKFFEVQKS